MMMILKLTIFLFVLVCACSLIVTGEADGVGLDDDDDDNSEEIDNPCPWVCKKLLEGQNKPFSCNETIWTDEPSWVRNWDYNCSDDEDICCQPWPAADDQSIDEKCDEKLAEGYVFKCAKSTVDCPSEVVTYDFACLNSNEICCVIELSDVDPVAVDDDETV